MFESFDLRYLDKESVEEHVFTWGWVCYCVRGCVCVGGGCLCVCVWYVIVCSLCGCVCVCVFCVRTCVRGWTGGPEEYGIAEISRC